MFLAHPLHARTQLARDAGRVAAALSCRHEVSGPPLPERPALDLLLEPHGLRRNPVQDRYERPGEGASSHHTLLPPITTVRPAQPCPAAKRVRADVYQADLDGPANPRSWGGLTRLAAVTAEAVAQTLFPPRPPMLLIQPGLMARYGLETFLTAMVQASRRDDAAAMFLLVPGHDTGGVPRINRALDIPGILASQALWVPRPWIAGAGQRAA